MLTSVRGGYTLKFWPVYEMPNILKQWVRLPALGQGAKQKDILRYPHNVRTHISVQLHACHQSPFLQPFEMHGSDFLRQFTPFSLQGDSRPLESSQLSELEHELRQYW